MSRSELRYFGGLLRPVPPGARVPLPAPSVRGSAEQNLQENTRQCERMGQEASTTNVPVMWHGAFWDTHVFFNEDGSVDVGIGDPARVPHGLDAPAESFVPESRVLHRVSRKAVTGSKPRAP